MQIHCSDPTGKACSELDLILTFPGTILNSARFIFDGVFAPGLREVRTPVEQPIFSLPKYHVATAHRTSDLPIAVFLTIG